MKLNRNLILAIVLLIGSNSILGQDEVKERSAYVNKVTYSYLRTKVYADDETYSMYSYPEEFTYTFENTVPVNLRMSIYIPKSDYIQKIFFVDEIQNAISALRLTKKPAKKPKIDFIIKNGELIKRGEKGFVESEKQGDRRKIIESDAKTVRSSKSLRSATSPTDWIVDSFMRAPVILSYGLSDAKLAERVAYIETEAFSVWTSDIKTIEAGDVNMEAFRWDSFSNRAGISRTVDDEVYYVLENVLEDGSIEILDVTTWGLNMYLDALVMDTNVNGNSISETVLSNMNVKTAHFIVSDPVCTYYSLDAVKEGKGLKGLKAFWDYECSGGVIAYAEGDNVHGTIEANKPTTITWQPVSAQPSIDKLVAGKKYYEKIVWYIPSFEKEENYSIGRGYPVFYVSRGPITFTEDFPLKQPSNEGLVYSDDKVSIVKEGDKIIVSDKNGSVVTSIELYDLNGKLINSVAGASIPVPCVSCKQVYLIKATIGGKVVTQLIVL